MADNRTPADELRAAAQQIRDRANAATPGPWTAGGEWMRPWELTISATYPLVEMDSNAQGAADAEHIASWHPARALAVADWLDFEADMVGVRGNNSPEGHTFHALQVARAYVDTEEGDRAAG